MSRAARVLAVVCVATTLPLLAPGTASARAEKQVPVKQWVAKFCTNLLDWGRKATDRSAVDAATADPNATMASILAAATTYFEHLRTATDKAAKAFAKAGYPDTPQGKQAAAAVTKGFKTAAARLKKLNAQLKAIDPNAARATVTARLDAWQGKIEPALAPATDALDKLDHYDRGAKIEAAGRKVAACRPLLASSSTTTSAP